MRKNLKKNLKNNPLSFCLIGLGNPGTRYEKTRHNVGFSCLDHISDSEGLAFKKQFLKPYEYSFSEKINMVMVKPLTCMNNSAYIIPHLMRKFRLSSSQFIVIFDNLDLEPGTVRLKKNGGSGGQKGMASIIDFLQSSDFPRISIGIGHPGNKDQVVEYVLSVPGSSEQSRYKTVYEKIYHSLSLIHDKQFDKAVQILNSND